MVGDYPDRFEDYVSLKFYLSFFQKFTVLNFVFKHFPSKKKQSAKAAKTFRTKIAMYKDLLALCEQTVNGDGTEGSD